MNWLARLTLFAYPRAFRHDFGADYLQAAADLHTHSRCSRLHVAGRLVGDAFTTATAMRWENLMKHSKTIVTVIAAVLAVFGLVVGPAVALPMLALAGALVFAAWRHDQPIATEAAAWGGRWYVWLGVAAVLFLVGFAMVLTGDDGDMSTPAWVIWLFSWLAAAIVAAVGLGLGATRLVLQRRA